MTHEYECKTCSWTSEDLYGGYCRSCAEKYGYFKARDERKAERAYVAKLEAENKQLKKRLEMEDND